jgi:hypothetical protein
MRIYFDSSVYSFIQDRREGEAVRTWLRTHGHQLVASDEANVGEALAIKESDERSARIVLIQRLADWAWPPSDLVMAEEVFREVARSRRSWIKEYPGHRSKKAYRDVRRSQSWDALRADSSAFTSRSAAQINAIQDVIQENRDAQAIRRQLRGEGPFKVVSQYPNLQRAFDQMSAEEQYFRVTAGMDYLLLLTQPVTPSADTEWLAPMLAVETIFQGDTSDWGRFWATEIDPARMPVNYLYAMALYCQEERKVTRGNTVDRIHMTYLHSCHAVITCDRGMFASMECALALTPSMGQPTLLTRSAASVVAELEAKLDAQKTPRSKS